MPTFRNVGPYDVSAFRPEGDAAARLVKVGDTVEVPGAVVTEGTLPLDAYVVEYAGERRAWPHEQWELVLPAAAGGKDRKV